MELGREGKLIIYIGIVLIVLVVLIHCYPKIPFLGQLPGDTYLRRGSSFLYFPLVTSRMVSLVLSLALYLLSKLK